MDTGESTKETVKTIARGMPVIRLHLWRLRSCAFSKSHAGPWVLAEAPGIPCALCFFEGVCQQNSDAIRAARMFARAPDAAQHL